MQVISGKYRGRKLISLETDDTKPTLTRIKGSVFDLLQGYISECEFLDLFAGSGAIGMEALSRGAKHVYFVDSNPDARKTIEKNMKNVDKENFDIIIEDCFNALDIVSQKGVIFDLVYLDPPYKSELYLPCLRALSQKKLVKNGSLVCLEQLAKNSLQVMPECYTILKSKNYGDKNITILEYEG
ncbi:MAG: 16S rRNA (guanine(966)-N(2))-methyltransferase RsmD [Clostridia bacterium]|nr:16S rRNA (guanine(966)-N(2))-methyltransferase RsmD [Clostridia bacterium]